MKETYREKSESCSKAQADRTNQLSNWQAQKKQSCMRRCWYEFDHQQILHGSICPPSDSLNNSPENKKLWSRKSLFYIFANFINRCMRPISCIHAPHHNNIALFPTQLFDILIKDALGRAKKVNIFACTFLNGITAG